MTTATHTEIVHQFLTLDPSNGNWGTWAHGLSTPDPRYDDRFDPRWMSDPWNVTDDTYINGLMLTFDEDYIMGYLIEVVERSSSVVSWVMITTFSGSNAEYPIPAHDSCWWEGPPQTFFDRTVTKTDLYCWAAHAHEAMYEAHQAALRAANDENDEDSE